uniref:Kinesin-like protein n=1 Tax=Oreochromis niloticus TaxID=8128 RepID=A0A669CQ63_ORENI
INLLCLLQVALRIRPLSDAEQEEGATIVAHRVDDQVRHWSFNFSFCMYQIPSSPPHSLVMTISHRLRERTLSRYNSVLWIFSPPLPGRTSLIEHHFETQPGVTVRSRPYRLPEHKRQIVQRELAEMLKMGIYNEMIHDLLNPSSGFLDLREDSKGVIQVAGITEVSTINAQEIMELLMKGNKQRTQEPTAANQTSSRSHAVLQVAVKQQSRCRDVLQEVRFARLFMIDLAGSERAAQTQNRGQRLKERAHINRSLLALGNCINALSDKNGNKYVNYRDSKLTRLLKDSLGGNSRTVMIAHISPASVAFEESRNTLTYADRAKSIRTRVKKNMINVSYHIAQYTNIISDLRCEIERLKKKIAEQASRQLNSDRADIRNVQGKVSACIIFLVSEIQSAF